MTVILILLLLWLLPPFINALARLLAVWIDAINWFKKNLTWLPEQAVKALETIGEMPVQLFNWLGQDERRLWWIPGILFPWFPKLAGLVAAWILLDRWKKQDVTAIEPVTETPSPTPAELPLVNFPVINPSYNL